MQECSFTNQNAQTGFGIHTAFCAVGIGEGLFPGKTAGLCGPTSKELHLLPERRSIVPVYWHFSLHDTWDRLSGLLQLLILWLFRAEAPGLNLLGGRCPVPTTRLRHRRAIVLLTQELQTNVLIAQRWDNNTKIEIKERWGRGLEYSGSRQGQVAGFCEHGNEYLGSIKCGGLLD